MIDHAPRLQWVRGPVVQEVRQDFGPWVAQSTRLAQGSRHLEITYTVGPVPVADGVGREVISRFTTSLQNAGLCYTDSNGREMQPRRSAAAVGPGTAGRGAGACGRVGPEH